MQDPPKTKPMKCKSHGTLKRNAGKPQSKVNEMQKPLSAKYQCKKTRKQYIGNQQATPSLPKLLRSVPLPLPKLQIQKPQILHALHNPSGVRVCVSHCRMGIRRGPFCQLHGGKPVLLADTCWYRGVEFGVVLFQYIEAPPLAHSLPPSLFLYLFIVSFLFSRVHICVNFCRCASRRGTSRRLHGAGPALLASP